MIFEVTQSHIDAGRQRDPALCPIALSILARFPGCQVTVGSVTITIETLSDAEELSSPTAAVDFINSLDNGRAVAPFSFELSVSDTFIDAMADLDARYPTIN